MKNKKILFLLLIISSLYFTGCRVLQPSKMFRAQKSYEFDQIPPLDSINPAYKIAPDDNIQIRLFSNDGFKMLEQMGNSGNNNGASNMNRNQQSQTFIVDYDGTINLPILGRVEVAGLTARECEFFLEEKYAEFYINPFIILTVTNRRVIIFPGAPGQATVLPLVQNQTTLLEALAMAGGIREEGKAYRVKLIRGNPSDPEIFLIDLSRIDHLKYGNMIVQSEDIIYIDQRFRPIKEVLSEVQPFLQLSSTMLSLITTITIWSRLSKI